MYNIHIMELKDIKESNNLILNNYYTIGTAVKRRLKRELESLYLLFNNNVIISNDASKNLLKVTITEIIDNKKQQYDFIINNNYPFVSPKIFYQNRPYLDFLKVNYNNKYELALVRKINGRDCFCCQSLNCSENWSPAFTLDKIINEIHRIKQTKRAIINKLLADKIKFRYLIDDIDLDSWLFTCKN